MFELRNDDKKTSEKRRSLPSQFGIPPSKVSNYYSSDVIKRHIGKENAEYHDLILFQNLYSVRSSFPFQNMFVYSDSESD